MVTTATDDSLWQVGRALFHDGCGWSGLRQDSIAILDNYLRTGNPEKGFPPIEDAYTRAHVIRQWFVRHQNATTDEDLLEEIYWICELPAGKFFNQPQLWEI